MKIEKTELVRFEVPTDNVSLWIIVDNSNPYYFVEHNGEKIGTNDSNFKKTEAIFRNIRTVLRRQNNILRCNWCEEYVSDTKKYILGEGYKENLCPKCHSKAADEYKSVVEVT